jgi:hypothetical protein
VIAHPFQLIPPAVQRWAVRVSLALTIVLAAYMTWLGWPLMNDTAPQGLISLTLARTPVRANQILQSWQAVPDSPALDSLHSFVKPGPPSKTDAAFRTVLVDYGFLLSYAILISIASLWAGGIWGIAFAWLIWVSALFDAVENTLLLRILTEGAHSPLPENIFACSIANLGIAFAALLNLARKLPKMLSGEAPR